ncbi:MULTISPECIES: Do family serine endopeptidase [unclassified Lentimonas]|uniref:Do family serine endopeptidase n=1 Tax=unclassified Lentimonas TaxID=2630993 RepID=UPI001327B882|nr:MULTISPECIES: Do family serine endopeptidase [unclassified Lentimonas]CAA6679432.1 HtrA protease/chaperone protein [Lentimonas sp. CC4]CAA6687103.1 HtrA protease/chaperone protein [Lentimonas sp. CC6]CAA7075550.1 HtrA protease/chaperone protein [Lentimonas sp. CC4]CAA7170317.1 HtrA protease/chaperone protein [Lentimonas sp. CC21]CAA7182611.1 HtrA protease/chaperone protein [Lentimonas sp. CC8]
MKPTLFLFFSGVIVSSLFAAQKNPELRVVEDSRAVASIGETPVVSYADVLDKATPSVVAVYTSRLVQPSYYQRAPQGLQDLLRQFGRPAPQSQSDGSKERMEQVGVGSGVILSEDGYIVTNYHVIQVQRGRAADEIRVRLSDDVEYVATLVGSDEKTDVAVLKIEPEESLPVVTIADSAKLRVGDIVFAIGNPLDVGLTATQGIVSALGRDSGGEILGPGSYENFIQTDASVNLGNSGGALIDAAGRLIGINTAIVSGSGGSIGIGFAIPSNMVLNVVTNLIESGEVPRGLLGLIPVNLTPDLADAFELPSTRGALVNQVIVDSPAEMGGIRHGDIIMQVDDVDIKSAPQLRLAVSQMRPGRKVEVTLIRQGETLTLPVVLGSLTGSVASLEVEQSILEGVQLLSIDSRLRKGWSLPDDVDGVGIGDVLPESPYSELLARGMVIVEVNGNAVTTTEDLEAQLQVGANRLYIWSSGTNHFIALYVQE